MINKIGFNNTPFKGTYLRDDETAQKFMGPQGRMVYRGELRPFPQDEFVWHKDIMKDYSEKAYCDVVIGFKEKEDGTYIASADIYDRGDEEKIPFLSCEEDLGLCKDDPKRRPFLNLCGQVIRGIYQRRLETNIYRKD